MTRLILIFVTFIFLSVCFVLFIRSYWIWALRQARRRGIYPPEGQATMFDVRQLLLEGEKELAIRVYCDLFKTSRQEAVKAVEELARSIMEKDKE